MGERKRVAGVTIPLFSLRSERSFGIGEIGDLAEFGQWVRASGIKLVQLLPLGEISGGETSPYAALSAFGIDPIYISIADLEDLPESCWTEVLGAHAVAELARVRASERVDYDAVRALKDRALRAAYARFVAHGAVGTRAAEFARFIDEERAWLDGYARFRALKERHGEAPWWQWTDAAADVEIGRFQYAQWVAHEQWRRARAALREIGVEVMGDLPFMVSRDSADVWSHQGEFRADASVGVPPDQFNEEGQHWGLPPYAWDVMRANGFAWLRQRSAYSATLYDRFRVDHLVGFFRTYMRRESELRDAHGRLRPGFFDPAEEHAQVRHGESVLRAMIEGAQTHGARVVAEDLGVIPNYVRPVLAALGVPGYKVLIWEQENGVFRDPKGYPEVSLACFATHDTDPVAVWWETREPWERGAVSARIPAEHREKLTREFTADVHAALLDTILGAQSELVLLMMQDALGTRDRINVPATVGPHNWTWRLPATVDALREDAAVTAAMARVKASIERAGR